MTIFREGERICVGGGSKYVSLGGRAEIEENVPNICMQMTWYYGTIVSMGVLVGMMMMMINNNDMAMGVLYMFKL